MTEIEELEHEHRLLRARNERLEKEIRVYAGAIGVRHSDGDGTDRADDAARVLLDLLVRTHEALRGIPRRTPDGLAPHDLDLLAREINEHINQIHAAKP